MGDGALGFRTALRGVVATTREQRCWLHKSMNMLNGRPLRRHWFNPNGDGSSKQWTTPKSVQAKAKGDPHDIWQAETKATANAAFDVFVAAHGVTFDKAVTKLVKDRDALLTFYALRPCMPQTVPWTVCRFVDRGSLAAEHWKHTRRSHPMIRTFATVRHRTKRTQRCLSRKTALTMAFKPLMPALKKWRKRDGKNRLQSIIQGVALRDRLRHGPAAA